MATGLMIKTKLDKQNSRGSSKKGQNREAYGAVITSRGKQAGLVCGVVPTHAVDVALVEVVTNENEV